MAAGFFLSIPSSIPVEDSYEEVFSLFTTDTAESPWAHNRSVSQQSTRLELELDFTPVPSPSVSRPGSRPDSRSGGLPTDTVYPLVNVTDQESVGTIGSGTTEQVNSGSGLGSGESYSTPQNPSPLSALPSPSSIQKVKNPAARLLGGRKLNRNGSSGSAKSTSLATSQQSNKKPLVIHQSLSTLSQPGQTGTVVWDSSILMSKFMLSIKGLTIGFFRSQLMRRPQEIPNQIDPDLQQEQVRRLEEQAENMVVSENGELDERYTRKNTKACRSTNDIDGTSYDEEDSGFDSEEDENGDDQEEENDVLVFDPAETSILELGSGCGLLGIVLVEFCQDLLLTDQKPVLPLLIKNLRKNLDKKYFDQDSSAEPSLSSPTSVTSNLRKKKDRTANSTGNNMGPAKPCRVQVQELVWGQDLDQDLSRGLGVDFIVATDVIYNESVVPLLVRTLKDLCEVRERVRREYKLGKGESFDKLQEMVSQSDQSTGDADSQARNMRKRMRRMLNKTVVLLAQELRTDYVHLSFLEELQQAGFRMVRMPKHLMDADFQSGYVIYACFLKTAKPTWEIKNLCQIYINVLREKFRR
ncbi:hypothetical protein BGX21_000894 [Mortierella sp. AD011]|nr:hypothetical protein BGX20_010911 [Mortierella sp. AD010]KAF9401699.1 hypothetical protein BGX21_000894 [Mortierella sp. AD011]